MKKNKKYQILKSLISELNSQSDDNVGVIMCHYPNTFNYSYYIFGRLKMKKMAGKITHINLGDTLITDNNNNTQFYYIDEIEEYMCSDDVRFFYYIDDLNMHILDQCYTDVVVLDLYTTTLIRDAYESERANIICNLFDNLNFILKKY